MQMIPEINPVELLHQNYQPINKYQLAELLGVSYNTVCSWIERKRNPATPVKKLAGILLQQWRSRSVA